MARYIALLRAVNVGGCGKLRMKELSHSLETAGFLNVQTVLASGNVVLDTAKTPTAELASRLETLLTEKHSLTTDVMVMKGVLDAEAAASFIETWNGPERIEAGEACLYIHYTDGMGKSKLKLPRTIGIGTVRNWNTFHKLLALS